MSELLHRTASRSPYIPPRRLTAYTACADRARCTESQLPHHLLPEAPDLALAGEGHELHVACLAGLEADGGAGGDVEAVAAGLGAVEFERRVGLGEVVVRADLDRAVAGVGDGEGDGRA